MMMVVRGLWLVVLALFIGSCASEDDSIVNPPPGNANVGVRFFNLVPDGRNRSLQMELGYKTTSVPPGSFSAPVNAPSDSSYLEVIADGTSEYKTPIRVRFTRQSIYDVIAIPKVGDPESFDTIMVSNANRSLTTQPVAQVRAINVVPDTSVSLDVRSGCPNGPAITSPTVKYAATSLYKELPPGLNVFSVQTVAPNGTSILGTYECTLKEFTPYSIIYYLDPTTKDPTIMMIEESDLTAGAQRPILPVIARDASVRVFNVSSTTVDVKIRKSGQEIVSNLASDQLSAYASVPTCEQQEPDVFDVTFGDGSTAVDSTALVVRGRYSIITTDTGGVGAMVIVPPAEVVFGSTGQAIVRVVHAANRPGGVAVSVGARTNTTSTNGYTAGTALTQNISFGQVSKATPITPGVMPITVTTSTAPTSVISIRTSDLQADRNYLLVLASDPNGDLQTYLFDETDQPGPKQQMSPAALLRFVNGTPANGSAISSIGNVVNNGRVFYRNSISTSVPIGAVSIQSAGASVTTTTIEGKRTLEIYTIHRGTETILDIVSDPLRQVSGVSDRRVINATADVDQVSIAYADNYAADPEVPHVAKNVAFGQVSPTHVLERDQRGSMYVYDSSTLKQLYTLPIDLGPLGNSYSLIVVGTAQSGYEVIVLQEF